MPAPKPTRLGPAKAMRANCVCETSGFPALPDIHAASLTGVQHFWGSLFRLCSSVPAANQWRHGDAALVSCVAPSAIFAG